LGVLCGAVLACAAKRAAEGEEKLDGSAIVTAAPPTQTDLRSVTFKGRVGYRSEGGVVPISNVVFTRYDSPDRPPTLLDIPVDDEGRFETELLLVTTIVGRRKEKRGTTVVVDSPGCSSLQLEVNDGWRPKTIELQCAFR
jgi:hypothetical protein